MLRSSILFRSHFPSKINQFISFYNQTKTTLFFEDEKVLLKIEGDMKRFLSDQQQNLEISNK